MVMHLIRAVAPTSFSAGSVEFSEEDYRCSITAAKLCTVDVELFLHRTQDTDSSINSHAKTILVVISKVDAGISASLQRSTFEDNLCGYRPQCHHRRAWGQIGLKWVMEAVLHDRFLTRADKVQLRDGSTDGSPDVTKDDILVAPTKFIVGDKGLTPNHIQQFECLMYRRDLGKQEAYPRDLLAAPNANVQPADSPTQQDDNSPSPEHRDPCISGVDCWRHRLNDQGGPADINLNISVIYVTS